MEQRVRGNFELNDEGVFYFSGKFYMLNDKKLQQIILIEAHKSLYTIYTGSNKMYRVLCELY